MSRLTYEEAGVAAWAEPVVVAGSAVPARVARGFENWHAYGHRFDTYEQAIGAWREAFGSKLGALTLHGYEVEQDGREVYVYWAERVYPGESGAPEEWALNVEVCELLGGGWAVTLVDAFFI